MNAKCLSLNTVLRRPAAVLLVGVLVASHGQVVGQTHCPIIPGDFDGDAPCRANATANVTDAIAFLAYKFRGIGDRPVFHRQIEVNRDFSEDITDAVTLLNFLFRGDPPSLHDVPLELFDPPGLDFDFGVGRGIACGDFNRDGYPDVFVCVTETLWENNAREFLENPTTTAPWLEHTDVIDHDDTIPPPVDRYSGSFGDYNNDGWPDIATEPRDGLFTRFSLLRNNLGDAPPIEHLYSDVTGPPVIPVPDTSDANTETACWADVDSDGLLDLFLPIYEATGGNLFFHNSQNGSDFTLNEKVAVVGLSNPAAAPNPEGVQFVDVDSDGDVDLYSNGRLYRNDSTGGIPGFQRLEPTVSGIGAEERIAGLPWADIADEGALLFDYDHDGDFDLAVCYDRLGGAGPQSVSRLRIWENKGDGTFGAALPALGSPIPDEIAEAEDFQLKALGMSVADWDNDGDMDLTSREAFRRNFFMETRPLPLTQGTPGFYIATHNISQEHLTGQAGVTGSGGSTPAWVDWDRDGDLDCALGTYSLNTGALYDAFFYTNTTYNPDTLDEEKHYVRVVPVRRTPGSTAFSARMDWLENEYGASVDIVVSGESIRRRQFTASSAGWINQNEYPLHFGLPDDPSLPFDVVVDFPGIPDTAFPMATVDKHVNSVLGGVVASETFGGAYREIVVFRNGCVVIDDGNGVIEAADVILPDGLDSPVVATTGFGGTGLPPAIVQPPAVVPDPETTWIVGTEFQTGSGQTFNIQEIVLDGQLEDDPAAGFNIALWNITDPMNPIRESPSDLIGTTSPGMSRSVVSVNLNAAQDRTYRLVAEVEEFRAWSVAYFGDPPALTMSGGLSYSDDNPGDPEDNQGGLSAVDAEKLYVVFSVKEGASLPGLLPPPPSPPEQPSWFIGTEFTTGTEDVRLVEVILDGQLANPPTAAFNIALWEMATPPNLISDPSLRATTYEGNHRTFVPVDLVAMAGKTYRLVAEVTEFREWTASDPGGHAHEVSVNGALSYEDSNPIDSTNLDAETPDAGKLLMAFRYRAPNPPKQNVTEDFETMPVWTTEVNDPATTWSIVADGESGNALQSVQSSAGASTKVKLYTIDEDTCYRISVWAKSQGFAGTYSTEFAYRLGNHSAEDLDTNIAAWSQVVAFSDTGQDGNGDVWTEYSMPFHSDTNTEISVGIRSSSNTQGGGPTVQWDSLQIE